MLRRQRLARTDCTCHRHGAGRVGDRASSSPIQTRPPSSASFDYSRLHDPLAWQYRSGPSVGQPIAGRSFGWQ
jgi:hypothetical protein